jgi:hypothetical protein
LGFGLQELKQFRRKLDEVDEQAGKPAGTKASVERFFRFFDEYYCDYYNLSDKVKELQSTITESTEKLDYMSSIRFNSRHSYDDLLFGSERYQ